MRQRMVLAASVCFCFGLAVPGRADTAGEARAIIDKAMAAAGGEEKLGKYKGQTWKEKGTFYGMGAGLPYTAECAMQIPDQLKMVIQNAFTLVMNGDKGWNSMGGATTEMTKEQLAEQKDSFYIGYVGSLLPLKDKAFKLSTLGESKLDGKTVVGVKVAREGRNDVMLYFDKDSTMLTKTKGRIKDAMSGMEMTIESVYLDYKDIDGLKMPAKIIMTRDGKKFVESEITELKLFEKLGDDVFAKP